MVLVVYDASSLPKSWGTLRHKEANYVSYAIVSQRESSQSAAKCCQGRGLRQVYAAPSSFASYLLLAFDRNQPSSTPFARRIAG